MGCSLPGSSVHGILQARMLEWVAMPSSRGSSGPRDRTHLSYVSCTGRQVLYQEHHLGSPVPSLQMDMWRPGVVKGKAAGPKNWAGSPGFSTPDWEVSRGHVGSEIFIAEHAL